jgi:hypothetical protein
MESSATITLIDPPVWKKIIYEKVVHLNERFDIPPGPAASAGRYPGTIP